jgi:hypothetical protein
MRYFMSLGIKESKEGLIALVALGAFIVEAGKDGFDLNDISSLVAKIFGDAKFRDLLEAGLKGSGAISEELKDLQGAEAVEIVAALVDALRK